MTHKIFPINTETACLSKWNWSTIFFNSGTSASCHRTRKYPIDPNNFSNFHNLPEKVGARKIMLDGQWPGAGCEYCKNVEEHHGISARKSDLNQLQNILLIPPELHDDPTETSVTPTILEVYFANTCNMACVYCGPHFSSKWEDENRRFNGEFGFNSEDVGPYSVQQAQHNIHYENMVAEFWQWLAQDDHYKTVQRYHVLGGEPFLLKELDASIDFWKQHGNPDLVFSVITNLNIPHTRFVSYIKKFERLVLSNKIWKLQLTASLDCWGPEQEYVRWGLDLALWQKNFEFLLNQPWIEISINSAISALTVKQMPALIEKINGWNQCQNKVAGRWKSEPILYSFNTTGGATTIYNFGSNFFAQDFERVLELMPSNTNAQRDQLQGMQGIANTLANSQLNVLGIEKLKQYLTQLDFRRNTRWQDQFSWLDQDFSI